MGCHSVTQSLPEVANTLVTEDEPLNWVLRAPPVVAANQPILLQGGPLSSHFPQATSKACPHVCACVIISSLGTWAANSATLN